VPTQLATVTAENRAQFERDGFVALDGPVIDRHEIDEVLALLEPLLRWSEKLPPEKVHDLAVGDTTGGRILEIDDTSDLAPELRRTAAFARCRVIAEELLERRMSTFFDHVIAKPPHNLSATPWHQDAAYSETFERPPATHLAATGRRCPTVPAAGIRARPASKRWTSMSPSPSPARCPPVA
jgi:hypothetical protein